MAAVSCLSAQDIVGKWKTFDDNTGKAKSIVEIYRKSDGKYYGKILKLFLPSGETHDPVCENCPGERKNRKVVGMEVITGLEYDGKKEYKNGKAFDPESGKTYSCKLWLDDEHNLKVRGYLSFLYRTQTWKLAGNE